MLFYSFKNMNSWRNLNFVYYHVPVKHGHGAGYPQIHGGPALNRRFPELKMSVLSKNRRFLARSVSKLGAVIDCLSETSRYDHFFVGKEAYKYVLILSDPSTSIPVCLFFLRWKEAR